MNKDRPRSFAAAIVQEQMSGQIGNVGNLTEFSLKQIWYYLKHHMKISNYSSFIDVRNEHDRKILIVVRNKDGSIKTMSKEKNKKLKEVDEMTGLIGYDLRFAVPSDEESLVSTKSPVKGEDDGSKNG
jgi:hypothetical protein